MKTIFFNSYENRLRSGWRILIFSSLLFSFIIVFSLITGGNIGFTIPTAILTILLIFFAAKKLDKRDISEYGFKNPRIWFRDFLAGFVMAAIAMSSIVLIKIQMGWSTIEQFQISLTETSFLWGISLSFILMLAVSFWEEVYFRSYLITNLKEGFMFRKVGQSGAMLIAVLLSSAFFGLLHYGNPNASWVSTLNISIAGLVFAYPYIITKSIAIPIGMHLSWNFFQGAVYGLPVSGNQFEEMFMVVNTTGPEVFTGGSFGPEAGAAGLLGLMILLTLNEIYCTLINK